MNMLAIILAGLLFVAVGIIVLISDFNWQGALLLIAIGSGFILYFLKK